MPSKEAAACKPVALSANGFNSKARIPYGVSIDGIRNSMSEFLDFVR
jgi:hypothetical protein